jgi:hypothetical protein
MNAKIICLVLGLVIGGLVGWLTRPEAAEVSVGPVSIEVQGTRPARPDAAVTTGQSQHIAIYAVIGALIGFGLGFVADRRR